MLKYNNSYSLPLNIPITIFRSLHRQRLEYQVQETSSTIEIDINALVEPISDKNPGGIDLRKITTPDSLYYAIKEARNHARAAERRLTQGFELQDLNPTEDWKKVLQYAIEILKNQSKDLEVCTWFIEASLRIGQFGGLNKAFSVTRQLCEKYWDFLFPASIDDDLSFKTASLIGLNGEDSEGTLIMPILNTCIIDGNDAGRFALWQYQQALEINKITDNEKKAKRLSEGGIDINQVERAISKTSSEFISGLIVDLENCLSEFSGLVQCLSDRCGQNAPPSSRIKEHLNNCLQIVKFISKKILPNVSNINSTSSIQTSANQEQSLAVNKDNLQNRNEVLMKLSNIAEFFRVTEPHSPISYLIEKVVRWANMPLPDLLNELISDNNVRSNVFELAGISLEKKSE